MIDDTIPFPAAEDGETEKKAAGGAAAAPPPQEPPGTGAEEARPAPEPAPAPAALAPTAPARRVPGRQPGSAGPDRRVDQRLSLFIDFENIALGVRDAQYKKFDINLVLQRLIEKGRIVYKKAYADWTRYSEYKREFHEAAIELIDIPQRDYTGKNSADIRMVVDAMDLAASKAHITTFVICSGDSDFSPLVSKLKENDKAVIGVGVKNSTSDLLISNCDEFIFYEDLVRETRALPSIENLPEEEAGGLPPRARLDPGAPARELRRDLGLDGQADDAAQAAVLQRVVLRLQVLLGASRGRAAARHPHDEEGRQERRVHRGL